MDKLIAIQVFTIVANSINFADASGSLKMTELKVIEHIEELERWLNCRLINRAHKKISLTLAGELYFDEAKKILALVGNFKLLTNPPNETPKGKIRISCSAALAEAYIAKASINYLNNFSDVEIELIVNEECSIFNERIADIEISHYTKSCDNLVTKEISKSKTILCATPHYLRNHPPITHPKEIKKHKIILCHNFTPCRKWSLNKKGNLYEIDLFKKFETNNTLALKRACMSGGGIAKLPIYLVAPLIHSGELVQVLPEWETSDLRVWAMHNSEHQLLGTIRSFITFLIDFFVKENNTQIEILNSLKWQ